MSENAVQPTEDQTREVIVYEKEVIMDLLKRMDGGIAIRGIDNMRAFIDVFDTLNKNGDVQNAVPVQDDNEATPVTEDITTGDVDAEEEVVYVPDPDEENIPEATAEEIVEEETKDGQ